jgi:plasmid rolling circle replication initiator protein Rep
MNQIHLTYPTQFEQLSTLAKAPEREKRAYLDNKQYLRVNAQSSIKAKTKKKKKLLSEKWKNYYQTRTRLSRLYDELGNEKKSQKIQKCSSFFNVLTCGSHIEQRVANFHCNNRLCPECAKRRANRLFFEYQPIVNAFLSSRPELSVLHLVLTQAQRPNETLKDARKRLIDAVKRLIDRRFWKDSFVGSLNSYEFTISEKTYVDGAIHYHCHLLVFCKISDKKRNKKWLNKFREVWSAVSNGENKNLKIRPVIDLQNGLREVLKYVVKPQDIAKFSTKHLAEIEELHKSKMVSTSGEFHKFVKAHRKEQKSLENEPQTEQKSSRVGEPCSKCKKPLYELQMPIKQLIIFAQDIEQRAESPPA